MHIFTQLSHGCPLLASAQPVQQLIYKRILLGGKLQAGYFLWYLNLAHFACGIPQTECARGVF